MIARWERDAIAAAYRDDGPCRDPRCDHLAMIGTARVIVAADCDLGAVGDWSVEVDPYGAGVSVRGGRGGRAGLEVAARRDGQVLRDWRTDGPFNYANVYAFDWTHA